MSDAALVKYNLLVVDTDIEVLSSMAPHQDGQFVLTAQAEEVIANERGARLVLENILDALRVDHTALQQRMMDLEAERDALQQTVAGLADDMSGWMDNGESLSEAIRNLRIHTSALTAERDRLQQRVGELEEGLNTFIYEWGNRGETTSLYQWNIRMKGAIEKAAALLPPPVAPGKETP